MEPSALPVHSPADNPPRALEPQILPSGRTVVVRAHGRGEEIEIRSAAGELELRIALTEQGPLLTLRGARLEIDSTDTVAVKCRQFELQTTGGMRLEAGGDVGIHSGAAVQVRSAGDTFIDGDFVKINCQDRADYHDDVERLVSEGSEPEA